MKLKILLLTLLFYSPLSAQETMQPYHWANAYIEYFIVRGELDGINKMERPLKRMDVAKALLKLDLDDGAFSSTEKEMIKLLLREFEFEGWQLTQKKSGSGWVGLMNKAMQFLGKGKKNVDLRAGAYSILGYESFRQNDSSFSTYQFNPNATLAWQDMLTLHFNLRIFNKDPRNFAGTKIGGIYAFTEQGYLDINTEWLGIKFGRDYFQLGPGQSGQLLFSDNSRPFDMYHFRLGKNTVQFTFWGIFLDPVSTKGTQEARFSNYALRYLNGHRLSFNIAEKYRFAFSEVALYGGADRNWGIGFVNPLVFYYANNQNNSHIAANIFYNFEWDMYFKNDFEFYGEFLWDDFHSGQSNEEKPAPNEFGIISGLKWANSFCINGTLLNVEYVRVRNRTYNFPNNYWGTYLHRNQPIGYALGNNLERYFLDFTWWANADLKIGLNAGLLSQGIGPVQGKFNIGFESFSTTQDYNDPFPFGTVESDIQAGVNLYYRPSQLGHLELDITNHRYKNYQNIKGQNTNDLQIRFSLWLQWDYIFENDKG